VNQRALTLAEDEMLEGGERQQLPDSRWRSTTQQQLVQAGAGCFRARSEAGVEVDIEAPARRAVEQGPGRNWHGQHFLEAEGLGTKLHTVRVVSLGFPALVLYGKRHPVALDVSENSSCYTLSYFAELDHVGLA